MTDSSHPDIDAAVIAWNAKPTDDVPDPHAAVVTQLQGNAGLVRQIRDEIARLEDTSGPRALLHANRPDYVSMQLHQSLTDMLGGLG
jgi:hypothetical protein